MTRREIIEEILNDASVLIAERTGLDIKLRFIPAKAYAYPDVEALFEQICRVWKIELSRVKTESKTNELSMMRKVLWFAAYTNFPGIRMQDCASLLGRVNHTSPLTAIHIARGYLDVQDNLFMKFYSPIKHLINDEK